MKRMLINIPSSRRCGFLDMWFHAVFSRDRKKIRTKGMEEDEVREKNRCQIM